MRDLSIIIPIYNEEGNIPSLFDRISQVLSKLQVDAEVIFVNDGSLDKSIFLIRELAMRHSFIRYIDFSRNFGHQLAVTAGLDHSSGKAVVIIDADLQDPPELIVELYNKW